MTNKIPRSYKKNKNAIDAFDQTSSGVDDLVEHFVGDNSKSHVCSVEPWFNDMVDIISYSLDSTKIDIMTAFFNVGFHHIESVNQEKARAIRSVQMPFCMTSHHPQVHPRIPDGLHGLVLKRGDVIDVKLTGESTDELQYRVPSHFGRPMRESVLSDIGFTNTPARVPVIVGMSQLFPEQKIVSQLSDDVVRKVGDKLDECYEDVEEALDVVASRYEKGLELGKYPDCDMRWSEELFIATMSTSLDSYYRKYIE